MTAVILGKFYSFWAVFLLTLFDQNIIVYLSIAAFVLSTWVLIGDLKIFLLL